MLSDKRTKLISFRLTVDEYERLRFRSTRANRSFSELVRAAVNSLLKQSVYLPQDGLDDRVAELEARVSMLCLEVEKLGQGVTNETVDTVHLPKEEAGGGCGAYAPHAGIK
jgi:predicted DNA-binding protein